MGSSTTAKQTLRQQELQHWVTAVLSAGKLCTDAVPVLSAISGDAGFRNYYRIAHSRPALLAVDAPPATEKNQAFFHIAQLLRQYGIHAPQVYAVDYSKGFLLIEDMGDAMYWPLLLRSRESGDKVAQALYGDATNSLLRMQHIPVDVAVADAGLTHYDADKLQQEMALFPEWFVKQLLQVNLSGAQQVKIDQLYAQLIASAREQPQVVVHRDFHCRNLIRVENNNPGVIDFQDAVIGPITYDLVSLYRDCYIRWPDAQVDAWVSAYYQQLLQHKIITDVSAKTFLRWFDWMGLQRHMKVLGIFSRLYLRDQKAGYLKDLPLVIHYTVSVAKRYPEFADFVNWFEQELLPRAKKQDWYSEINA